MKTKAKMAPKCTAMLLALLLLVGTTLFSGCFCIPVKEESLNYHSYGNGTCAVESLGTCKGPDIVIPETSPDGDTVVGILYGAFWNGGAGLTSISIPNTVTYIAPEVFDRCGNLTYNQYQGIDYLGNDQNPYMVLIRPDSTKQESYTIHEDTRIIYSSAFARCKQLKTITIPSQVISIGDYAFSGCSVLTEMILPEGLTCIGEQAFSYCEFMTTCSIPDSIEEIGLQAFGGCYKLKTTVYEGMKYIGNQNNPYIVLLSVSNDDIFETCEIHPNTKFIMNGAFSGCTRLERVWFPVSLLQVQDNAFRNCWNLEEIYYAGTMDQWQRVDGSDEYSLRGASVYYNAVKNEPGTDAPKPNETDAPKPNETDAPDSGDADTSLDHDTVGSDADQPNQEQPQGMRFASNGDGTCILLECDPLSLTSTVVIPNKSPDGDTVVGIDYGIFAGTNIVSITIPDGVTEISESLFAGCYQLKEVKLSDNLTLIDDMAFIECSSLKSIVLPAGLEGIGYGAFFACDNLTDVYFMGTEEEWSYIEIGGDNDSLINATVHFNYVP